MITKPFDLSMQVLFALQDLKNRKVTRERRDSLALELRSDLREARLLIESLGFKAVLGVIDYIKCPDVPRRPTRKESLRLETLRDSLDRWSVLVPKSTQDILEEQAISDPIIQAVPENAIV